MRTHSWCAVLVLAAASTSACAGGGARYEALRAAAARPSVATEGEDGDPFHGHAHLGREALVRAVLRRNPTLAAGREAWRAAIARHPQATAYDDPMLGAMLGPASYGRSDVDGAWMAELSQRVPFPGKLALRGEAALAEAEAAGASFDSLRLELALAASWLLDDYALAARSLEVERHHVALLEELLQSARARFEAGEAALTAPVQADAERAHRVHDRIVFETALRTAAQRINLLLHRAPDAPLPPPPPAIAPAPAPAPSLAPEAAIEQARAERPRLRALRSELAARDAALELARREYFPDFELRARWDAFWQETSLQPAVGFAVNVPLRNERRAAAVDEAEARREGARHALRAAEAEVAFEVANAIERLREAEHVLHLQREELLPAAETFVSAARDAFDAGTGDFGTVVEAERGLWQSELAVEEAVAEVSRRRAALERALGRVPGLEGGTP